MTSHESVNWSRILYELVHNGVSIAQTGREVGIAKSTITRFSRNQSMPRHDAGEAIIELWMKTTGKSREELPKMSRFDWRWTL